MSVKGRKVLVVGSARVKQEDTDESLVAEDIEALAKAGREIGAKLAEKNCVVLVGSDFKNDVDPHVVAGALEVNPACPVEVHVPRGTLEAYPEAEFPDYNSVKTCPHQFEDWDVTVMDTIEEVDGIIAIGGRVGVIQAGLAGWKMGKPVIPVAAFGGGGRTMWDYGSATRQRFYRNALSDSEIDQLAASWSKDSAQHVVNCLEVVARRTALATSSMPMLVIAVVITLLAALGWFATLIVPYLDVVPAMQSAAENVNSDAENTDRSLWLFFGFVISISLAGLLGGAMQTLRRVRDGRRLETHRGLLDIVLGFAAGLVTAMLFLIAQIVVQGEIAFDWSNQDYSRIVLISSMASLFASLYLDSALSRFDTMKDSVMSGSYKN